MFFVHFSEDGRSLYSVSRDGSFRIWNLNVDAKAGQEPEEKASGIFSCSREGSHADSHSYIA